MIINFNYPYAIKGNYCTKTLFCECVTCGYKFNLELPGDDVLVKLVEKDGVQVKWLPTYGVGGYLDLAKKLAPKFNGQDFTDAVSMKISKIMELELPEHTEKGISGNGFIVGGYERICPNCNSKDIKCNDEKVAVDLKLDWVKISDDLLE